MGKEFTKADIEAMAEMVEKAAELPCVAIPVYFDVHVNVCSCGQRTIVWAYYPAEDGNRQETWNIAADYCAFCGRKLTGE